MSKAAEYAAEYDAAKDRKEEAERNLRFLSSNRPKCGYVTVQKACYLAEVSDGGNLIIHGYSIPPIEARKLAEWILATFTEL